MELLNLHSASIIDTREEKMSMLTQAVEDWNDPEETTNLAMTENEIDD